MLNSKDKIPFWGRWEGTFEAAGEPPPGTEITVEITSPSGKHTKVPGFWDGGYIWRVRVMPDEEGEWHYQTEATDEYPGLHRQTGSFDCQKIDSDNRFLKHGPIRVSADGHYLEHADSTPFFYLGDTAWNGLMLSKEKDWEVYLQDRVDKQFSGIQFVTLAPWRTAYSNREGEIAYTDMEFFPINPHFFRRIDKRMDAINDKGLLALPALIWEGPERSKWDPGKVLGEEQLLKIIRYQIARYQAHNVLWILMGDGSYKGELAEKWKRIGRAVFGETKSAPVAIHPCGRNWPYDYDTFGQESWMDVIGYQSGHGDGQGQCAWIHSGPASDEWQLKPARPIIDLEPCYEDILPFSSEKRWEAYGVRRNCYWTMLNAPPAGLTYGAHGIWCWHEQERQPLDHSWTGSAKPWHLAKDLPGSFDMKRLAECFTSIQWWKLRPCQELLRQQPYDSDKAKFVSAACSESGDLAMLYLPVGCEIQLNTDKLKQGLQAYWFDPRTGERTEAKTLSDGTYNTPDEQDWVLLII